jgi:alkylhydroperoxidase/carboxymuconolactone decarboxylase family protein YurZ
MSQKFDAAALVEAATGRAPDAAQVAALSVTYKDMLGFVPPRVSDRLNLTSVLDPRSMELQEAVRTHALDTPVFDSKTVQLVVFGMLMMDLSDAALTHAIAARRAGATWDELQAVISLCFLFRGLPAANRGASVLAEAMQREAVTA